MTLDLYARYTDQCAKFYTPDTQTDIRQIHRPVRKNFIREIHRPMQETRKIYSKLRSPLVPAELDFGHSDAGKAP